MSCSVIILFSDSYNFSSIALFMLYRYCDLFVLNLFRLPCSNCPKLLLPLFRGFEICVFKQISSDSTRVVFSLLCTFGCSVGSHVYPHVDTDQKLCPV